MTDRNTLPENPKEKFWTTLAVAVVVAIVTTVVGSVIGYYLPHPTTTYFQQFGVEVAPSTYIGSAPLWESFGVTVTGGKAPYNYTWSFGDGTGSYVAVPIHVYKQPRTYTARLVVTDSNGNQVSNQTTIRATVATPLAVVINGPINVTTGTPVTFSANASGGEPPYSFTWSLGNGAYASGADSTVYVYRSPGLYNVSVTVKSNDGYSAVSNILTIQVHNGSNITKGGGSFSFSILTWALIIVVVIVVAMVVMRRRKSKDPFASTWEGTVSPSPYDGHFGGGQTGEILEGPAPEEVSQKGSEIATPKRDP